MATQMTTSEIEAQGGTYRRSNGDTQTAIVNHVPSGDTYAVRWVSVWNSENECIGLTISDIIGPLHHTDVRNAAGVVPGATDAFWGPVVDALDGGEGDEDLDWAREQDWQEVQQIEADAPAIRARIEHDARQYV